jgi:hypothetical protein
MAGTSTVTINMPTYASKDSEAQDLRYLLHQVAQQVGSGLASRAIIHRDGSRVGSYTYGAGMANAGR